MVKKGPRCSAMNRMFSLLANLQSATWQKSDVPANWQEVSSHVLLMHLVIGGVAGVEMK